MSNLDCKSIVVSIYHLHLCTWSYLHWITTSTLYAVGGARDITAAVYRMTWALAGDATPPSRLRVIDVNRKVHFCFSSATRASSRRSNSSPMGRPQPARNTSWRGGRPSANGNASYASLACQLVSQPQRRHSRVRRDRRESVLPVPPSDLLLALDTNDTSHEVEFLALLGREGLQSFSEARAHDEQVALGELEPLVRGRALEVCERDGRVGGQGVERGEVVLLDVARNVEQVRARRDGLLGEV